LSRTFEQTFFKNTVMGIPREPFQSLAKNDPPQLFKGATIDGNDLIIKVGQKLPEKMI